MPDEPGLILVLDTGPAIALDMLRYGQLLERRLPGTAVIPSPVARELLTGGERPGAGLIERIPTVTVSQERILALRREWNAPASVHDGELGVIALTQDLFGRDDGARDVLAVIDDLAARKLACRNGLTPATGLTGTLGVLRLLHAYALTSVPLAEEIALLQASGYRFSRALVDRALESRPSNLEHLGHHRLSPRQVVARRHRELDREERRRSR